MSYVRQISEICTSTCRLLPIGYGSVINSKIQFAKCDVNHHASKILEC